MTIVMTKIKIFNQVELSQDIQKQAVETKSWVKM